MRERLMSWVCGALLVAGCGELPSVVSAESTQLEGGRVEANVPTHATLCGQVHYLERSALPPDTVLEVKLLDVSRADTKAKVLASEIIKVVGQAPMPFTLHYDPSQIVPQNSYSLQARLRQGKRLLFINTQRYAVLTRGAPKDQIEIRVHPVVR